jgi:hypothetical protein
MKSVTLVLSLHSHGTEDLNSSTPFPHPLRVVTLLNTFYLPKCKTKNFITYPAINTMPRHNILWVTCL